MAAASQDGRTGMLVAVFICPLPNIAHHVHHAERAGPCRVCVRVAWRIDKAALAGRWHHCWIPCLTPRIGPAILALRGVLPLPFVWQALARPLRVRTRVLNRDPCDRLFRPAA